MKELNALEPLSKFKHNMRLHQAVCKNCKLPQKYRNTMHRAINGGIKVSKSTNGPPVERQPKGGSMNFYRTKPYPYSM